MGVEQPDSGGGWEYRAALRRGKLEMWNNDFYWPVGKQIHNSLDPGTHASPASPPGNPLLRGCSASVDEECDEAPLSTFHFLSCFGNAGRRTPVKGAFLMGSHMKNLGNINFRKTATTSSIWWLV